uniref:Cytochrome P450 71D7 n=1 Tax=Aegilops tauschii subsp. strangulata TaxID=200361 RepID=A0A453J7V3_AEGTS
MEQPAYCLCLFLALLLPLLLLLKLYRRNHGARYGGVCLPPGPWQLPVIGSLHHLAGNPLAHRVMADLARRLDAPLMYLKLGEVPVVVATSREAAREIMRTHDAVFASRPWSSTFKSYEMDGQGLIFARYGALWRQLRKICVMQLLSPRRVQSFRRIREEELARLVAAVAATPPGELVNVSQRIAVLITDSAIRAMIGDRFKKREEFLQAIDEAVKLFSGFNLGDLFPSSGLASFIGGTARLAQENSRKCSELMEYVINQHEDQSSVEEQEDLVDVLLRIRKEGGLEVPLTMGTIKTVIFETLRLHPAAPLLIPREASEPCKILGYDVPKGTMVLVNAWAIGRDPKHWEDPDEFKPERFESGMVDFKGSNFEYIPFGAGRRMCPGMIFAQASMEIVLATLLYHFDWELPAGDKPGNMDMNEEMGITVRRKKDLWLHVTVRVPPI